jgi:hypothetical protein
MKGMHIELAYKATKVRKVATSGFLNNIAISFNFILSS